MQPLISEFSYGYALTQELAGGMLGNLIGAPVFPSLRQEGSAGGGYDVQIPLIGFPLFLQFKLSDYLSRTSASERTMLGGPYYRMHLRPLRHSDQHNLLLDLEAAGNEVYYAAPEFHTQPELNSAYLARQVFRRSRFFRPSAIGALPDRDGHYICFRARQKPAYLFSDSGRGVLSQTGEEFAKGLADEFQMKHRPLDLRTLESLSTNLESAIEKKSAYIESVYQLKDVKAGFVKSRIGLGRYLAHLSWVFFDSYLVFVGRDSEIRRTR